MVADYKIVEQREENGQIVYQRVRFYSGAETTENEPVRDEVTKLLVVQPVTRYRRNAMIEEVEYTYGY